MSTDKIRSYLARYNKAKSQSDEWMSAYQDAYKYAIPQQTTYYETATGEKRGYDVYDSTLADSLNSFVGKMMNRLIPQGRHWLKLIAGPDVPDNDEVEANRQLSDRTKTFFKYIDRSNFYAIMGQAFRDWAIGTMVLVCNETDDIDDPLMFGVVPIDEIYLERSAFGKIKTLFRRHEDFHARDLEECWPRARLTDEMSHRLNHDSNYKFCLVEANVWDFKKRVNNYVLMTEDGEHIFLDEESTSSPFIVVRQGLYKNDAYGRGSVLDLMPDVKTLNKMREDILKQQELALNPPLMSFNNNVINTNNIRFEPNSVIPVESLPDGRPNIQPYVNQANFQVAYSEMDIIRRRINKCLFTEPLGPVDTAVKTATEVNARIRELVENLSPAVSLFSFEFNKQFVERVLHILSRKGHIEPLEDKFGEPLRVDEKQVSIKFDSPLALSQGLTEMAAIEQFHALMTQIFGEDTAATFYVSADIPMYAAERFGVDPNIIMDKTELESMAEQLNPAKDLIREEALPTGQLQMGGTL